LTSTSRASANLMSVATDGLLTPRRISLERVMHLRR
jgi:hypothetical protein